MTDENEHQKSGSGEPPKDTFVYGESGIQEKRGGIPLWLILVAVGLIAWGIWYTIANWSPPA